MSYPSLSKDISRRAHGELGGDERSARLLLLGRLGGGRGWRRWDPVAEGHLAPKSTLVRRPEPAALRVLKVRGLSSGLRRLVLPLLLVGTGLAVQPLSASTPEPLVLARNAEGQYLFIRSLGPNPRLGTPQGTKIPADRFYRYDEVYAEAGRYYSIDPLFIKAVMTVESGMNPTATSRNKKTGKAIAHGMAQMIPGTAKRLGVEDPYDPIQAVWGCAAYLRRLSDIFEGNMYLMAAGYNAGEGAVRRAGNKVPNYQETKKYVPVVLWTWNRWHCMHQRGT